MSGEQRAQREKFREVTLCFHQESICWGFITTESFEIHPSLDSTKHTVFKGNICSNSPPGQEISSGFTQPYLYPLQRTTIERMALLPGASAATSSTSSVSPDKCSDSLHSPAAALTQQKSLLRCFYCLSFGVPQSLGAPERNPLKLGDLSD